MVGTEMGLDYLIEVLLGRATHDGPARSPQPLGHDTASRRSGSRRNRWFVLLCIRLDEGRPPQSRHLIGQRSWFSLCVEPRTGPSRRYVMS